MLLADGTYYVLEAGGEPVACGGRGRRGPPFTRRGAGGGEGGALGPRARPAEGRGVVVPGGRARRGAVGPSHDERGGRRQRRGLPAPRPARHAPRSPAVRSLRVRVARARRGCARGRGHPRLRRDGEGNLKGRLPA